MRRALLPILLVGALGMGAATAWAAAPARPAGITAADRPAAAARAYVAQHARAAGVHRADEMSVSRQVPGVGGTTVVHLQQQVDGVPVLGGEAVVVVDAANRVLAADGATLADPPASATATVSAVAARRAALAAQGKSLGAGLTTTTPRLVVADAALLGGPGPPRATTAWDLQVSRGADVRRRVLVDATTGGVIAAVDLIETAKSVAVCNAGNANAATPCTVATPFARIDSATPNGNAEVDAAYERTGATYDFYAALGRDSIDGAGLRILSTVNFCQSTCPYLNAYWDGTQMVFGAGLASSDDVVAHELTHGVTSTTSGLVYWYQSGAINEAMSDIMGELFDLGRNPLKASTWTIGEGSPVGIIRNMANPPALGDPDRIGSPNYVTGLADNGGVHTNSGVANKAAYLISDGGAFNGQVITGIGRDKSTLLWYQSDLALRMSSGYSDLADTLQATCTGLVNLGTYGFTPDDCVQVGKATTATQMRVDPLVVPTACAAGQTATDALSDSFGTGISTNWSTAASIGGNAWYSSGDASPDGATMHWPSDTSSNARGVDGAARSDSTMAMRTGVTLGAGAYLLVRHWFQLEASPNQANVMQGYDGGLIEYSTDNGSTWTSINGLTTVNGYNGTIDADGLYDNPLRSRDAFIAASNGATTTRVDLSPLAGQTVRVRFRIATDTGGDSYGWYIGSVRVGNCTTPPPPAPTDPVTPANPVTSTPVAATPPVETTAPQEPSSAGSAGATERPTAPPSPRWTPAVAGRATVATFAASPGTTYGVRATRRAAGRAGRATGRCRVTGPTATCSIRLMTAGTWDVVVTPTANGRAGAPVRSTVRVRRR